MVINLENILHQECSNTEYIHLYQYPGSELWTAYDESALNLIGLVPELRAELKEEVFSDCEIRLYCVRINSVQMVHYGLPYHCILLGDYYIKLQKTPVTELQESTPLFP